MAVSTNCSWPAKGFPRFYKYGGLHNDNHICIYKPVTQYLRNDNHIYIQECRIPNIYDHFVSINQYTKIYPRRDFVPTRLLFVWLVFVVKPKHPKYHFSCRNVVGWPAFCPWLIKQHLLTQPIKGSPCNFSVTIVFEKLNLEHHYSSSSLGILNPRILILFDQKIINASSLNMIHHHSSIIILHRSCWLFWLSNHH